MPSLPHEELCELVRLDPGVLVEMLRTSGRLVVPAFATLEVQPGDLTELLPASYRADAVVVLEEEQRPVLTLVFEVQLSEDGDKRYSWPCYAALARARYRCPVCVVVYAPDPAVAAWASEPIEFGLPGSVFRTLVLGPSAVPVVRTEAEARRGLYRAVLSALSHGNGPGGIEVAEATWKGLDALPADRRDEWRALLLVGLNEAARRALEQRMNLTGLIESTDIYQKGLEKGLERSVLRGIAVSEEARQRFQNQWGA